MREQTLLSRRALAAALSVVAIGPPALAATSDPDAKLLALGSQLEVVHAARIAFDETDPEGDDPFYERHWQPREEIHQQTAATVAGVAVKARAAQMALHYDPVNENEGDGSFWDLSCSLISDLLELRKGGLSS